jgi:hypothetical protein
MGAESRGEDAKQNTGFGKNFLTKGKGADMLWIIFVILLILWLLGMIGGYVIGGFIHILLVIAIVVVLIRIIQGRRPL